MDEDVLSRFAEEAESDAPSDEEIESVRALCAELVRKQRQADEIQEQLRQVNKEIWELKTKTIPDLAVERGIDSMGLADYGVDVVVEPYYKANISADWPEEQRARAFEHLEELGVGDIVRTRVEYTLGKDSLELAHAMDEIIRSAAAQIGADEIPTPEIGMSVPWNTLTSTVKDLSKKGVAMDLEVLGATVGNIAKIKERKE